MQILGKVLQVPSQSLEDLTLTLKEEMKIKNPLPTLEKRRYKISDTVSDDYNITYEEKLELAENEECINLSLENIEVNESEPIVSVTPEYKAYFRYENHATSSTLEEFLSGDTTRFNGNISQLGTTELKKDLELSDKEIERLSATNETWGSDGLYFDDTTDKEDEVPKFEIEQDDDEYSFNVEVGTDESTFKSNEQEVAYSADVDMKVENTSTNGGINFIENKELTNLDTYFNCETVVHFIENFELRNIEDVFESDTTNRFDSIVFIEDYTLDNLDEVVELESDDGIEDDYEEEDTEIFNQDLENDFDDGIEDDTEEELDNLDEVVELESDDGIEDDYEEEDTEIFNQDLENDFDDGIEDDTEEEPDLDDFEDEDDFDSSIEDDTEEESDLDDIEMVSEDIDFGTETECITEVHEGGIEKTIVSDEGIEDDTEEESDLDDIEMVSEDIDFGTETECITEVHEGGIEKTIVSDEDLGFLDTSEPEELDFGSSTVSNTKEDDAYINKILNTSSIPDGLKKELIQDYLKTQSKGAVEVDLGCETVDTSEPAPKKVNIKQEEIIEYKDIRHFVRDHPRCTVQDVLKHFSKKQLEHDIMVGKVIRKGKILHI